MHEDKLLPCLCGATTLDFRCTQSHKQYAVACLVCNAIGPWKTDAIHAALAWNYDKMALVPTEEFA